MVGLPPSTSVSVEWMVADRLGGVYILLAHTVDCGPDCIWGFVSLHRRTMTGAIPAGWTSAGLAVDLYDGVPDGAGGLILAGVRSEWPLPYVLRARKIGPDGAVAAGWPPAGVVVSSHPGTQWLFDIASDGTGGAFVAWMDTRNQQPGPIPNRDIYAQRVLSTGDLAWATDGVPVCASALDQYEPIAWPDGTGNVFFTWRLDPGIQRLLADGSPAPGWPANGIQIPEGSVAAEGAGGAMIIAAVGRPGGVDLLAHRRTASGGLPTGWPPGGIVISRNDGQSEVSRPAAVPDGASGAYVTGQAYGRVWVHHVSSSGDPAPGWPDGGLAVVRTSDWVLPFIVSDGSGGAFLAWSGDPDGDHDTDVFLQRLAPDGPVPVLVSVVRIDAEPSRVRILWSLATPVLGAPRVQRSLAAPGWQDVAEARSDDLGRIDFEDRSVTPGTRVGYRLALVDDGSVSYAGEVWVDIPNAPSLTLTGFSPTPSARAPRVSFSLASSEPASLVVFDARGRRVASQEVGALGPGKHELELSSLAAAAPGIYFARLRQGARSVTARGCILR